MKRLRHPIRAIREPFGTAGLIVAVVALVFSMLGGAYAAKGALTGKQKKEVEKIAKKYAGKQGPQGPQGLPGAPGAKGEPGAKGDPGVAGTNGKNGADGEDGACSVNTPECTLPPGATLTGQWSLTTKGPSSYYMSISFPLQVNGLEGPVKAENWITETGGPSTKCPGSLNEPKAEPGQVCFYVGPSTNNAHYGEPSTHAWNAEQLLNSAGITFEFAIDPGEEAYGYGTWAVTAPEA